MSAGDEGGDPREAKLSLKPAGVHRIAVYAGTFDPIHFGHLDLIRRASKVADKLIIGVSPNPDKRPLFTLEERIEMVERETARLDSAMDIEVRSFDILTVHFARQVGANVLVRGLRAVSDFDYEFQMVGMNQRLAPNIEAVFLMADPQYQAIASKLVKEIARLEGDVSAFVPPEVEARLKGKFG